MAYSAALTEAHRNVSNYLSIIPTLGPMQMIEEYVLRAFPVGIVSCNEKLKLKRQFDGGFCHPWGVAMLPNDQICVGEITSNCVRILDPDGTLVRKFNIGDGCSGVAGFTIDTRGRFYAGSLYDSAVREISMVDGSTVQKFSRWGVAATDCYCPYDVDVSSRNEYICVADSHNNRVQVFTLDGRFIRMLKPPCSHAYFPIGICISSDDAKVAVVNYHDNSVSIFHLDGNHERTLYGFFSPTGVAFDAEDKLVVANTHGDNVQILQQDGSVVHSLVMLKYPRGVCVDRTGQIIVCNQGNNSVQIWG